MGRLICGQFFPPTQLFNAYDANKYELLACISDMQILLHTLASGVHVQHLWFAYCIVSKLQNSCFISAVSNGNLAGQFTCQKQPTYYYY
jgi:hypothetical protein